MRARTWIFTALAAVLFAVNLVLVSTRIAQTGEDTVRARLLQAGTALHAQLELIDARLSPRAAAEVPELAEATKAPADATQPPPRPDDRALRAAASALAPEPDLLAVLNAQGALVSRRGRPIQPVADIAQLPLAKAALERSPLPTFAIYEGTAYRMAAARVPGSAAAVLAGTAADDRLAAQLKTQVDADVTLIANGKVVASSLPADARERVSRWAAAPGPGYGVLQVVLPGIGNALSGRLPRGASRYAVRGTLVPLDGGVEAALTVPASPYIGWLARYQAFSLLALALLLLFGFVWGLLSREPERVVAAPAPPPGPRITRRPRAVVGTDAAEGRAGAERPAGDVPWTSAAAPEAVAEPAVVVGDVAEPAGPSWDAVKDERRREESAAAATPSEPPRSEPALAEPAAAAASFSDPTLSEPGPAAQAAGSHDAAGQTPEPAKGDSAKGDFSFAGLLDDAAAPVPLPSPPLAVQQGEVEWAAVVDAGQRPATDETAHGPSGGEAMQAAPREEAGPASPSDEATPVPPAPVSDASPSLGTQDTTAPASERPGFEMVAPSADLEPGASAVSEKALSAPSAEVEPDPIAPVVPNPSAESAYLAAEPASPTAIEREYLHRPDTDRQPGQPPPSAPIETAPPGTAAEQTAPSDVAPAEQTAPSDAAPAEPPAEAPATEAASEEPQPDPDEAHWRETYDQFVALRQQLGEPGRISYERFAAKLAKNREDLMARRQCSGVRFSVYEKEGRASIKASAVR